MAYFFIYILSENKYNYSILYSLYKANVFILVYCINFRNSSHFILYMVGNSYMPLIILLLMGKQITQAKILLCILDFSQ